MSLIFFPGMSALHAAKACVVFLLWDTHVQDGFTGTASVLVQPSLRHSWAATEGLSALTPAFGRQRQADLSSRQPGSHSKFPQAL